MRLSWCQSREIPRTATESADGSAFTIIISSRGNGTKGDAGEYDGLSSGGGWQSWSKTEKSGVVAAAVIIAVGIIVVIGVVMLIYQKRRIRNGKKSEDERVAIEKGNRAKEKRRNQGGNKKHSGEPGGIEMMETGQNGATALRSNHEDSRAGPRQGRNRQAAEPPMMSGALEENQKAPKIKRTWLPPIAERRINLEGGEDVSRRTDQTRQSPRTKGNDGDGGEGGL